MPEPIALDQIPDADPLFGSDKDDGTTGDKIQCPECEKSFMPSGIKRHITMAHRGGVSDGSNTSGPKQSRVVVDIAERWAQFQRGAGLMVAFGCSQCAAILVEDANTDGKAIAEFVSHKPKLRKKLETFLEASDAMILVGTLGNTAKKMAEHHSIGRKFGIGTVNVDHVNHGSGMEGIAQFMQSLSEEDRNQLLNDAFQSMAPNPTPPTTPQDVPEWNPAGV
jgi:hypothetical protein